MKNLGSIIHNTQSCGFRSTAVQYNSKETKTFQSMYAEDI